MLSKLFITAMGMVLLMAARGETQPVAMGIFESRGDVGQVKHPGRVEFDPASQTYTVTGGGANMWGGVDAFHFVWKRLSGDAELTADIQWVGTGGNAHRKACLILRPSLAADAPHVSAVTHGDGLTCLQFRRTAGGPTEEIRMALSAPQTLRIVKDGDVYTMYAAKAGGELQPAGSIQASLGNEIYVGIGVCSHDDEKLETAVFSKVSMISKSLAAGQERSVESSLEILGVETGERTVAYQARRHFEAPNWSRDGQTLLFNSGGHLYTIPAEGGRPVRLDTGFADQCNNDHGYSPDGKWIAISDQSQTKKSLIYTLPAGGGTPRLITPQGPSYWHGWSPDGRTLAYCAERNGEYDVYTIPAEGGAEFRLTDTPGLDDGPDYSPDGQWIYFNSIRSGTMKIWRMKSDGANPEPLTSDEDNDWFPHPSPDGKQVVFLSYEKGVEGHPANKIVKIRLIPANGGEPKVLAQLFGGQGTLNVPSWSPDSRKLALVSYRLVAP